MGGSPHVAPCGHESKTRSVCQLLMSLWFSDARMAKKKKKITTVNRTVYLNLLFVCLNIIFLLQHLSPECDALTQLNTDEGET